MTIKKYLILILMGFYLSACTSFNNVDSKSVPLSEVLETGERVNVVQNNGDRYELIVVSVDETQIIGTSILNNQGVTVLISDIASVEVETVDGGMTALAVAGGIVIIPIAILGIFTGAWLCAWDGMCY